MDDSKSWENSLRSDIYEKPTKAPRNQARLNHRNTTAVNPLTKAHSVGSNHPGRHSPRNRGPHARIPTNTRSGPLLHTYTDSYIGSTIMDSRFPTSPIMEDPTESAEDSPGSDNEKIRDHLNMIKKRQTLMLNQNVPIDNLPENNEMRHASIRDLHHNTDITGGSSVARFSRHITQDRRISGSPSNTLREQDHRRWTSTTDFSPPPRKVSTTSYMDRTSSHEVHQAPGLTPCQSTVIKVEDLDHLPLTPRHVDMDVHREEHQPMVTTNRTMLSETRIPSPDRKKSVDWLIDDTSSVYGQRRVSYARSFTRHLHTDNGWDSWDNWDVPAITRKMSTVRENDDEDDGDFLDDLLPQTLGQKKKGKVKNIRAQMNCCSLMWHDLQLWFRRRKYHTENNNPVFQKQIEIMESQFGSGTVSFFIYIRWLLLLNMCICLLWTTCVVIPQAIVYTGYSDMLDNFYFTNLIDGKNALSKSFMFYGGYEESISGYPLSLTYLICVLFTYFGSLFIIFKEIARSLEAGGRMKDKRYTYFNQVLTGWDYSITQHEAIHNMSSGFVNTFQDLISEARVRTKKDITKKDKTKLYAKRATAWTITVIMIGGGCTAIFFLISTDAAELFTQMGYQVTDDDLIVIYTPMLTFMAINAIIPRVMYQLPLLENYESGKVELNVNTIRVFILRTANILALVISLYNKQGLQTGCVGTYLGQELYKLVVLDTLIQAFTGLVPGYLIYYCTNKKEEFKMPPLVLVLLYRQALIWLGTLVCPVMPLVGVVSTSIFFAVNYLMVTVMCKPPVKRWNQARRNTLFLGLTAATLLVLILPISVVITRNDLIKLWVQRSVQVNSSQAFCGPFGNDTLISAYWTSHDMLAEVEPISAGILNVITSSTVLLPLLSIIIAVVYFQNTRMSWQKSQMRSIHSELITEREHNRDLMKNTKILPEIPQLLTDD